MRPSMLEKVVSSTLEKNVDDLVQMEHINEAMIVHNLRKRFKNDQIYV
jgi:myosin heavy subunit